MEPTFEQMMEKWDLEFAKEMIEYIDIDIKNHPEDTYLLVRRKQITDLIAKLEKDTAATLLTEWCDDVMRIFMLTPMPLLDTMN